MLELVEAIYGLNWTTGILAWGTLVARIDPVLIPPALLVDQLALVAKKWWTSDTVFIGQELAAFQTVVGGLPDYLYLSSNRNCIAVEIQKILIIRLSSIGDIILTTPLIRGVRSAFPEAKIDFAVKQQFKDLVDHNQHLNQVLVFDKSQGRDALKSLRKRIREEKYDWIIDIHRNFRSLYLRSGSGSKLITSYHKKIFQRSALVYLGLNWYGQAEPVMLRYFQATKKQGIEYDGLGTEVSIPDSIAENLNHLYPRLKSGREVVTICPGASFKNKQWLPERFLEVANYHAISKEVVFLGGPDDSNLCQQLADKVKDGINLAGKLTLLESAELLRRSSLVITNDSGMMHLAQSQKIPVVSIFGPTTRELGYFPMPERSSVIEVEVPCRPCTHNGLDKCPKGHFRCMMEISSESVIEASVAIIEGNSKMEEPDG